MIVCVRQCYCHPALIHPYLELRKEQTIFFSLQSVGGHVGLTIFLIASILLRNPRPDLTFINFCFTWVFSSIVFSIGLVRLGHLSQLLHTDNHRKTADCIVGVRKALCELVLLSFPTSTRIRSARLKLHLSPELR